MELKNIILICLIFIILNVFITSFYVNEANSNVKIIKEQLDQCNDNNLNIDFQNQTKVYQNIDLNINHE